MRAGRGHGRRHLSDLPCRCRQSKKQTRSYRPSKVEAGATSKRTRRPGRTRRQPAGVRHRPSPSMGVEADDVRRRVGAGEQQARRAVPTTDVGDPGAGGELGLDAVECGNPGAGQVVEVAGPEEAFAAVEDVRIVGAPGESGTGAKPLSDHVGRVHGADGNLERTDHTEWARLIGQRDGVLGGQRESAGTVVCQVAAGRLCAGPLPNIPLDCPGSGGQFDRGQRPGFCHRAIQPELVADHHHCTAEKAPTSPTAFSTNSFILVSSIAIVLSGISWDGRDLGIFHRSDGDVSSAGCRRVAERSPKLETSSGSDRSGRP